MSTEKKTQHKDIRDAKAFKAVGQGVEKVGKIKFISEFKDFISKGNVMDMAVGQIDFSDLKIVLKAAVKEGTEIIEPEVAIGYGAFINSVISFLLIALSVFILIKVLGAFKRKKAEAPKEEPKPDPQIELLTEIRDLLKGESAVKAECEEEEKEPETVTE